MIGKPELRGRPHLKVCCIASAAEAELAINHGADAVGLVSEMPSGPGVISDHRIEEKLIRFVRNLETEMTTVPK